MLQVQRHIAVRRLACSPLRGKSSADDIPEKKLRRRQPLVASILPEDRSKNRGHPADFSGKCSAVMEVW